LCILVGYSEIALKSRYVRSKLERSLARDLEVMLAKGGWPGAKARRRFGRLVVEGAPPEAASQAAKTFGVSRAMPCRRVEADLASVVEALVEEAGRALPQGAGFAVRARVVGDHDYSGRDVAYRAGARILEEYEEQGVHVDLDNPQVTLRVEVRDQEAYVYSREYPGVLGLPYGTQGKAVSLFSGGIDSPVAAWLMMKRGVAVLPLFMDQRPLVGESYVERGVEAFHALAAYVPRENYKLYSAPMGGLMERLTEAREPKYICVMCKRSMYRIAQAFAKRHRAKAIVTGESLGQVASQTLNNMYVLSQAVELPLLRPLVGLDKVEIEDLSRRIGLYSKTARKVEGCKAVPSTPSTRARLGKVEELEEELGVLELCREAAKNIQVLAEG